MNKQEQIIMSMNHLFNKIGWLNRLKLAENNSENGDSLQYTSSEIFCVEYIGSNVDPNGTKLADACFMTRSGLSKLTKKLMKKGIIESYQKPENKKEIYFRLTEKGQDIYNLHEEMTNKFLERDKKVFEQVPEEQLDNMLAFFNQYIRHLDEELEQMGVV